MLVSNHLFIMLKFTSFIFLLLSFLFSVSIVATEEKSNYVLVSVAPHKYFVEKIGGDTVKVGLMVPAGASSHTFEPTPKQMLSACRADLWFQIGEGFESRSSNAIKSHNPKIKFIDLRKNLDLITFDPHSEHHCCHHHESCVDLHFWLSPRLAKSQANAIAEALSEMYPEHSREYQARLQSFLVELENLDKEIIAILQSPHNSCIMVSHPAYAYFCRDYGFSQLSIEFEGKDPTPQQLTKVIVKAREKGINKVFIQIQYSSKGAQLIAKQLGAKVITLDPYSENYIESMREIAKAFAS